MSWTDVFPVFTEEMVDEFLADATEAERAELESWYDVERVVNPLPHLAEIVSMSLFWKNVYDSAPELPTPTRERLQNAVELGLADRFNPWDHYVAPLLELTPGLREKFPEASIRVYLAKDLEFLAEELAEAGCEVYLMKSSSINFAPGGLWRFLPFSEEGKTVVVTDMDRLNELESDLIRTRTMVQTGVGAWRVPVPVDLTDYRKVSYRPFIGCQFGVQGGLLPDTRQLLDAFTWHATKGFLDPTVIYPDCGPLEIELHQWPSYGFDEYFLNVAIYPRLAQEGMLSFVPSGARSLLLTLDIEYCTWGNPNSELVYFATGSCCGGEGFDQGDSASIFEGDPPTDEDVSNELAPQPKIGFLFLTTGELHHPNIWRDYLAEAGQQARLFAHVKDSASLTEDSLLQPALVKEDVATEWGSISLVRATLALLREGFAQSDCTHFILVSESCVPVRPFAELSRSLQFDTRSRIQFRSWSETRTKDILRAQRVEKMKTIRKELAHFQEQWMLLSREDAGVVLSEDYTDDFVNVFAPDECYFATVLALKGRNPRQVIVNRAITWTSWKKSSSHPESFAEVSLQTVATILESGHYFARKFPPGSNIGKFGLHLEKQGKSPVMR